jgi:hypothetical protein
MMATDDQAEAVPVLGFPALELRDLGNRWAELTCTACARTVSFVNPTPDRVRWYCTSHRCGPGRGWQGTA